MLKIARGNMRKGEFSALGAALGVGIVLSTATPVAAGQVVSGAITNATSTMNVTVEPSISLSVFAPGTTTALSEINFDDLDADGALHTSAVTLRVSTNAINGYSMDLQMSGSTTDLVNPSATQQIVGTTTNNVTASSMRQNSWGYSLDATNFSKVPANGSPATIKTRSSQTTTDADASAYEDTTLTFGVKVDNAIASGTYSNTVVLTAVAAND